MASQIDQHKDGKGGDSVDVRTLMAQIREQVRSDIAQNVDKGLKFQSHEANFSKPEARRAGELLHSEELRYLNANYGYSRSLDLSSITSHRSGIIGKVIVKLKRKVVAVLWDGLLKDYFEAEKNFNGSLVRFLNDTSKYIDSRDASNFWELISKVDVDVTRALDRIERIHDEQMATLRATERALTETFYLSLREIREELSRLQGEVQQQGGRLNTTESVADGIERIVGTLSSKARAASLDQQPSAQTPKSEVEHDYSYLLLENRFRGDEQQIKERLSFYPEYFKNATRPVLEIGSGRGELLELFKESGVPARGVDLDPAMVERSLEKKLEAIHSDGISYLEQQPERSLGGVIAIQVVEHLTQSQLKELIELSASRVVEGGPIIFETINPRSLMALSSNYFRDPTHVWPLHPDTLEFTMNLLGLSDCEIRFLSPVPSEALLKTLEVESFMTPRWAHTVQTINSNITRLNELLFGYQDYCVIARAPGLQQGH